MRLTVGPLPAAVYWRRRFAVLAALLILVLGVVFACSDPGPGSTAQPRVDGNPASLEITETPSGGILTPVVQSPFEETGPPSGVRPTNVPADSVVPSADAEPTARDGSCSDDEIKVTPVPMRTVARRGERIDLRLRIRNISSRTCPRDVGADLQEIYIKQGAEKVWSSDTCGLAKGSDVQQFPPNHEREYGVTWNGRASSRCAGGVAIGRAPAAGIYQVFGRLGTKVSTRVLIKVTD